MSAADLTPVVLVFSLVAVLAVGSAVVQVTRRSRAIVSRDEARIAETARPPVAAAWQGMGTTGTSFALLVCVVCGVWLLALPLAIAVLADTVMMLTLSSLDEWHDTGRPTGPATLFARRFGTEV